ncbi:MAG: hypothetical protein LCI00_08220 [Chloroflexi bacterium]|nr:hypothetical protein [Chloroflexota bacterium]
MTNPGLYSGIYQQIREIAELVDDVLVNLKEESENAESSSRLKLSELLEQLVVERTDTLSLRMVALLVIGDDITNRTRWARLSHMLKSDKINKSVIDELDSLAQLLEQVQTDAMAKMRGWVP